MDQPIIIFQDASIAVLDKPAGLLVHQAASEKEPTLADWLLQKFPQVRGVGEPRSPGSEEVVRFGIVHRLDRETSGIMLAALTLQAYARLKKQFARREVQKTYRAFVYGSIKEDRGVIEKAIGRSSTGNRTARLPAKHRPALYGSPGETELQNVRESQTTFKTLARSPVASYLELYPKTGRTHQIRVHLSALQHPVICDSRYAPGREKLLGFNRLALHAYRLSFVHPITGKTVVFEAPLSKDFLEAEEKIKNL